MTTKDPVAWIAKQEDGGLLLWDASYKHIQEGYDLGFNKSKRIKYYPLHLHPAHDDTAQPDWLLKSTQELAVSVAKRCYPDVPQFEVLNDLAGVISQIDNMTTGMERKHDDTALLRQALEALEKVAYPPYATSSHPIEKVITALRERLGEKV